VTRAPLAVIRAPLAVIRAPLAAGSDRAAGLGRFVRRLVRPASIGLGLALIVGGRWAATVAEAPPLLVGTIFGILLVLLALVGGSRVALPRPIAVVVGLAGAVLLVGLAIGASQLAGQPLQLVPKTQFAPWALITILVASAEELVLRGALFDALRDAAGVTIAVIVTSAAFALMHVPLYGWHVVPLDLGVGVFLAGLRLTSGSVAAPAMAHIVADLATWWV
jgi:membrane protease YdiL (CAAX protease family)